MEKSFEERIEQLNQLIAESNHIVFFGGAGVSTESGIPDFRSKDGLYNQHDVQFDAYTPEYLLSNDCLYHDSKVFFEFYRQKMNVEGIDPNPAHYKLAEMEAKGKLDAVITQNIDGLHQKAGSKTVYEVHGSTLRNYCDKCGKKHPADYIFKSQDAIPRCDCGGMVRPDVTLYGEMLPDDAWEGSARVTRNADLFIVGGTSGTVYPAANIVSYAPAGCKKVVINRDETQFERKAVLSFHENIGEVLSKVKL